MRTVQNVTVPFPHPKSQPHNNTECHFQLMNILLFQSLCYEHSFFFFLKGYGNFIQHILRKIIFHSFVDGD